MSSKHLTRLLSPIIRRKTVGDSTLHAKQTSASSFIQKRKYYEQHYEGIVEADPTVRGIELLRDPRLNKGMAFTLLERQIMGIHGLLPPIVFSQEEQADRIMENVSHWDDPLDTYVYLTSLQDRNEKLFYKILAENIELLAPIVYTPTVGRACENFGFIFRKPRGLYITINDLGNVYRILSNWPERNIKAIVVTDGERILGLGDLGAFGMGIPIGKLSLYTAMGGIPPQQCLPIVLDVGTDNDKLLHQDNYIGLRHKRVRGCQYYQLIDEFMTAVEKRFGTGVLVQFEDFANHNAFKLLEKYRDKYLTFNDDIQGTASVVVAGLIASMKELNSTLKQQKFLFLGAGEAAVGIANLLTMALVEEGLSQEEARDRIWMIDIDGLLTKDRKGGLTTVQEVYAKDFEHMTNLVEIVKTIKPTVALGASAAAGAFNEEFIREMTKLNERPVIFALSNPTSKAECTAKQAYTFSEGKCIFASGSPFGPVTYNGKTNYPGQGNNAYVFPGIALGVIVAGAHHVTDKMFLKASQALAEMVTQEHLAEGRVYPPLKNIREVSTMLATQIVTYAYKNNMAAHYPEPNDHEAFVRAHQYDHKYGSFVPHTYAWPGMPLDGYVKR